MIKKLIDRLFRRRTPSEGAAAAPRSAAPRGAAPPQAADRREPTRYKASEQGIRVEDVPSSAMRTCETLQKNGFKAFVVGGGVRDLLLGLRPKDFDVATDATP
ncbi:MAG TPA: polynucleotide adenylyltransferase PcnB, partial [Quisquiliibacterium sp.]|nr:polynucleotide adenylyltransferase PcnB [Quisquiliibacterium sp.]